MNQEEKIENLDIKCDTHLILTHLSKIIREHYNREYKSYVDKTSLDHLGYLIEKNINLVVETGTLSTFTLAKIHRNIGYIQGVLHCMGAHHIDKEIEFCSKVFSRYKT